jgi:hypothetical protein
MAKFFQTVKANKQKRTAFNLSHNRKMSIRMGKLYPCLVEEVVPGDKFTINTQTFLRFAPMIAPIMHQVDVYVHFFYVPNRIIYEKWDEFIKGDPVSVLPTIDSTVLTGDKSLADYLGVPDLTSLSNDVIDKLNISQLPFRAYLKIFNDYYRDENLQSELALDNQLNYNDLLYRAWEKDYFTSALPWTQKGDPVKVPVDLQFQPQYKTVSDVLASGSGSPISSAKDLYAQSGLKASVGGSSHPGETARIENLEALQDISAPGIDINDLRFTYRVQRWMERQARAGSRYVETILSHFGVHTGDARLMRPEYIGGGKQPVQISEVLNTNATESTGSKDLGYMAGHGISVGRSARASHFVRDFGYIMGIMSVMPKSAYQQGIPRHFLRQDRFDFYWPEFAHLGEQAVQNKELYVQDNDAENQDTFGYQSRYAEMKYKSSTVHGDMRGNLSFYHAGRIFTTPPLLNEEFIKGDMATIANRIWKVGDTEDQLWLQMNHNIIARRPMPYYGTPTL